MKIALTSHQTAALSRFILIEMGPGGLNPSEVIEMAGCFPVRLADNEWMIGHLNDDWDEGLRNCVANFMDSDGGDEDGPFVLAALAEIKAALTS